MKVPFSVISVVILLFSASFLNLPEKNLEKKGISHELAKKIELELKTELHYNALNSIVEANGNLEKANELTNENFEKYLLKKELNRSFEKKILKIEEKNGNFWLICEGKINVNNILRNFYYDEEINEKNIEDYIQILKIGSKKKSGKGFGWGIDLCCLYPWSNWNDAKKIKQIISDLKSINIKWVRIGISWRNVIPLLHGNLTIAEVTNGMVDSLAKNISLGWHDAIIENLTSNNISILMVVGQGYKGSLPLIGNSSDRVSPDKIGRENYLGWIYLYVRAVVNKYCSKIRYWQIENELNAAGPTATFFKWRTEELSWWDPFFLKKLIATLSDAVYKEGKRAGLKLYTVHNFHTDVPGWEICVRAWLPYLDVIGIDTYPNYLLGWLQVGWVVGLKVLFAKLLSDKRPVWVIETGFPTAPKERGFDENRQAKYLESAASSAYNFGASVFIWFTITSSEVNQFPWYEPQAVESYWGIIKPGANVTVYTKAWYAYESIINSLD